MTVDEGSSDVWVGEMALEETAEHVWTVTEDARLGVEAEITVGKGVNG